jgi:hypothetical protein
VKVSGTILATLALLVGFYQAPFSHIHPDDFDHPATSSPVHWHFHHEVPSGPTPLIGAPLADDDAIDVGWNALRSSSAEISFDFDFAETIHIPLTVFTSAPAAVPRQCGHDPPELASKSPRAPPL